MILAGWGNYPSQFRITSTWYWSRPFERNRAGTLTQIWIHQRERDSALDGATRQRMDRSRRSEDQTVARQVAKGTVARVRVAVKTTHQPTEIAPNDTLSLIWQAFCVLEGSPNGLGVIDHRTRCIRAPLLKRFCRFLENNAIDMDHATSVERLLHREAPHMDWKPVIPEMLAADVDGNKREPKSSVGRDRKLNTTAVVNNKHTGGSPARTWDHTGQRENPIDLIDTQDGSTGDQEQSRKTAHEQSKKKSTLSWAEASPERDLDSTHRPFGLAGEARTDDGRNMNVVARASSKESRPKATRKGGMRIDHSHMKLLDSTASTKTKASQGAQQVKSTSSPCDTYSVPVPSEAELQGDGLHAWPLLGEDLRFIFQPTLWPAFCKSENFRLPQCFLPGFGFGLIDSSTNTIRIALVLRFFRFLKRKEGQATMVRALRALNKLLLTESLARGLDWEIIALENVKPLLKIIGVSSLTVPGQLPAPSAAHEGTTATRPRNRSEIDSVLAMNRNLTSTAAQAPATSPQAANNRAQMRLLQLQQQWQNNGAESKDGVRQSKSDTHIRTKAGISGTQDGEIDPANRYNAPSPCDRNFDSVREDANEQLDIKSKCINVLHSVEELINAMEATHAKRSLCKPARRQSETNADEQQQYKMVAASLEDLTKKASLLLDDGNTDSDPMANTLIMLKSSVEALSSKLDAVSESLQSQSNRGEAPVPPLDLPRSYSSPGRRWSSFDHVSHSQPEPETNITTVDIDSARKRAILSHAAAERDRLKRQRMR